MLSLVQRNCLHGLPPAQLFLHLNQTHVNIQKMDLRVLITLIGIWEQVAEPRLLELLGPSKLWLQVSICNIRNYKAHEYISHHTQRVRDCLNKLQGTHMSKYHTDSPPPRQN